MTALAKTFTLALCRCCFDRLTGEQYAEPPLASARFEYTRCHGPGCDYDLRIPVQVDHRFRCNPITDSGPKPITFRR